MKNKNILLTIILLSVQILYIENILCINRKDRGSSNSTFSLTVIQNNQEATALGRELRRDLASFRQIITATTEEKSMPIESEITQQRPKREKQLQQICSIALEMLMPIGSFLWDFLSVI
jgi:hypothetical protein